MKKIFLIPLSFALVACVAKSNDFKQSLDSFKTSAHTLIEPDNNNYWKNNFNAYHTYPINFYSSYNRPAGEGDQKKIVNLREYARNTAVSARKGQRMVDSETVTVTQSDNTNKYMATSSGKIFKANTEMKVEGDKIYRPIGEVKIDGSYFLLFDPQRDGRVFLIDSAGQVIPKMGHIDGNDLILSKEIVVVSPSGLRMIPANPKVSNSAPQKHFEIKYDGIKNETMAFIYTNYENNTVQRFTYPEGRKTVDINGVKFNILKASPDHVIYMIIE